MEIIFYNKNGIHKLCMLVNCNNIMKMSKKEVNKLTEILNLNDGFQWLPKGKGYAEKYRLPVIKA